MVVVVVEGEEEASSTSSFLQGQFFQFSRVMKMKRA